MGRWMHGSGLTRKDIFSPSNIVKSITLSWSSGGDVVNVFRERDLGHLLSGGDAISATVDELEAMDDLIFGVGISEELNHELFKVLIIDRTFAITMLLDNLGDLLGTLFFTE